MDIDLLEQRRGVLWGQFGLGRPCKDPKLTMHHTFLPSLLYAVSRGIVGMVRESARPLFLPDTGLLCSRVYSTWCRESSEQNHWLGKHLDNFLVVTFSCWSVLQCHSEVGPALYSLHDKTFFILRCMHIYLLEQRGGVLCGHFGPRRLYKDPKLTMYHIFLLSLFYTVRRVYYLLFPREKSGGNTKRTRDKEFGFVPCEV